MAQYDPRTTPYVTDQRGDRWHGVPGHGNAMNAQPPEAPSKIVLMKGEKPPKHPCYEKRKQAHAFYQASYDGGHEYRNAMDADGEPVFQKHSAESEEAARRRKSLTTYRNYSRAITDKFFAYVFGAGVQRPSDGRFDAWCEDVDGHGTTYDAFVQNAVKQAFILGTWYVIADTTKASDEMTQAQAQEAGARLVLADLHPSRIINWAADESELLVCHSQPDHEEVWLWGDSLVTMCTLNERGEIKTKRTAPHGWKGMPIVKLIGLNGGASLIKDVSELNKRLFHDDSLLAEESEKQIFTQYFILGMDGQQVSAQDSVSIGSRKYICLKTDAGQLAIEKAAGDAAMGESLRANIEMDVREIYRTAGLRMNEQVSGPESGRALRIRQADTSVQAERLATNAETGENSLLALYNQAFGTDVGEILYSKDFNEEDLEHHLKETLDTISSPFFGQKLKAWQTSDYIKRKFAGYPTEILKVLEEEAQTFSPSIPGQEMGQGQVPFGKRLDAQSQNIKGIKEQLGDGQEDPEAEPDNEALDADNDAIKAADKGASSGATSSGKADPGELRKAPEGDIRFDTQKVMLDPSRRAAQHKVDEEFVAKLAESMKTSGFDPKHPILVAVMDSGEFATLDGHHRQEAAVRAGIKGVPANALTQAQLSALLLVRFGGGLPRKMSKLDPYVFVDGKSYDSIREKNTHKTGGKRASGQS